MAQHLHLTSSCRKDSAVTSNLILSERICTYIWPHLVRKALHLHSTSSCQKGSTLTSNLILSKRLYTYIWSCGNTSRNHIRISLDWSCGKTTHNYIKASLHLHLIMWSSAFHHVRKANGHTNFLWREPQSGEHQASPWSTQNSLRLMVCLVH